MIELETSTSWGRAKLLRFVVRSWLDALLRPLHRLSCVAFAGRGANATLTLAGPGQLTIAHCRRCGFARVLIARGEFREGDFLAVGR